MKKYEPLTEELNIIKLWEEKDLKAKLVDKNAGEDPFYFLDGPPYTSGKVHLGTAWNKSLKDAIIRYKRMQGFDVVARAGYDMHGLPTENATEKKLNIKGKEAIAQFGVDNFVKACKELSISNLQIMNKDFLRLGSSMDFDDPYMSVANDYISGVWWLVKQAADKGRLYRGKRSMAWDWAEQTAIAKHELVYQDVTDTAIYVKMRVEGTEDEYFVIWTTTPWTIPSNLAIMVNPDMDYVKIKVNDEFWWVAQARYEAVMNLAEAKGEIVQKVKGSELLSKGYHHPLEAELKDHYSKIKENHPNAHTVVGSKQHVDSSSGTGLVHTAPGCGPEDYEVGHANDIPAWNLVKEDGVYDDSMGPVAGLHTKNDDAQFVEILETRNAIVAKESYAHSYPHGERSKKPVIFRATSQWFFKIEDIKEKIIKENNKVAWVPKAGYNAFNSWLENLRDNSISKQRYWGTPLPIWVNTEDESDYFVVGSLEELEVLSEQKIDDPHIPWIDDITITKEGKTYKRVPDVLDVWVDAGSASWNSLNFMHDKKHFERYFPADFILEGKDQIRGWFNLLMVGSVIGFDKASFKATYMHGFINDASGRKMSKSLGNYILPGEVIEKYGADTLRYYTTTGTAAGLDLNYNFDDMKVKYRNLGVLWNIHNYIIDLAKQVNANPAEYNAGSGDLAVEEKYILSKLASATQKTTDLYEQYRLNEAPLVVEDLFLQLSRTYLQLTREKLAESDDNKKLVLRIAYIVLKDCVRMFAPTAPFITEMMFQNMRDAFKFEDESIHLATWPSARTDKIDSQLESNMERAQDIAQVVLSLREKVKRGVRWPMAEVVVATTNKDLVKAAEAMRDIIKTQTNVKDISVVESMPGVTTRIKPNFKTIGAVYGKDTAKIAQALQEVAADDVMSAVQDKGHYLLSVEDAKHEITQDHFDVERTKPDGFLEGTVSGGYIYLKEAITDDLEAEGFAREVMRRVQSLRKEAGLQKTDVITCEVTVDEQLLAMLGPHEGMISNKVGAQSISMGTEQGSGFEHTAEETVKGKKIVVSLSKVN